MKCENCSVDIGSEFIFAIKNNQCPACGGILMQQSKLSSYISLKTLLENNFKDIDVDKISALIVANFELRQLFKEELLNKQKKHSIVESKEQRKVEDDEGDVGMEVEESYDPDYEHKEQQKKEAKAILQRMRDEALSGAQDDRYGVGGDLLDENMVLSDDPVTNAMLVKMEDKKRKSSDAINSGAAGAFRRNDG